MAKDWTTSEVIKLFRLKDSSKTPLLYAEEKGEIPTAGRVKRGKVNVRKWNTSQLPAIGKRFGFLQKNKKQIISSTYTPKGGVAKTTFTANLARTLAINGIKTIVCGLDFQRSLTRFFLPPPIINSVHDIGKNHIVGLHHLLFEKANLDDVIQKTDLPTLDIIPETSDLNFMAKKIRLAHRREYIFKERLIPHLKNYDVILFDGNPGWSDLIENALSAANTILMPIACEAECYEALQENLGEIEDFRQAVNISWDHYYMIPTFLENNSISQNIYAQYLNIYEGTIIPCPIRRSIIAQEARLANLSILEYAANSNLALDYYDLIPKIWEKLTAQVG